MNGWYWGAIVETDPSVVKKRIKSGGTMHKKKMLVNEITQRVESISCLWPVILILGGLVVATIKKILIVDDDPQVHKILSAVLTKNYQVDLALDASEAWKKLTESRPDLIVLDIMMPDMSGIDLCKKIRSDPSTKEVLILMLSAKDTQNDRIKGLQYGADDYVTKPFHVSTLVHKIEHMLTKERT